MAQLLAILSYDSTSVYWLPTMCKTINNEGYDYKKREK